MISVVRARMAIKTLADMVEADGNEVRLVGKDEKYFIAGNQKEIGEKAEEDFAIFPRLNKSKKVATEVYFNPEENSEQLVTYSPNTTLEGLPDLGWSFLVASETKNSFATLNNLRLALMAGTAVAAILVGALAAYLANRAVRPIVDSAEAVKKIGQGDFDTQLSVVGQDELGVLGDNINLMAQQIKDYQFQQQETLTRQEAETRRDKLLAGVAQTREPKDLEAPLNALLSEFRANMKVDRVVVYRFKPDWGGSVIGESVLPNLPIALASVVEDACIPEAVLEDYRNGRVVPMKDVFNACFHPDHMELMERLQIKANLVVPILQGRELFGLLVAHDCTAMHDWQPSEIEYLKQASIQLGSALGGLALFEQKQFEAAQAQERTRKTQLLAKVAQSTDTQALIAPLNPLLEDVRTALKADRAVIYRFYADWSGHIAGEAVLSGLPAALADKIEDPCIPKELRDSYLEGRVVPTDDVFNAGFHPEHLDLMKRLQIKANLVVPIVQGAELLGLLVVHHCTQTHHWQQSEIDAMQQFADQFAPSLGGLAIIERKQFEAEQAQERNTALQMELLTLLQDVEGASSGDLTVRADVSAGEIGIVADFFNAIVESLRDIVSQVKESAGQVNTSVGSNEVVMGQLADQAQSQAHKITDTLKSVELMALSIQQVAENARQASKVSGLASKTAESGGETIDRTVESILQLRDTVAETAKKVKRLGESSQQISKVVSLINQIALQTNLLAINASIEAARAGEEGRGFAVVAEEVGALAAQSAAATKEIEGIVDAIQRETSEVVNAMENGTTQVVEGTRQVNEAKASLNQIVKVSREIDDLLKSISSATVSQTETSQVVKLLMEQITESSEQTSTTSRQVSSSLQETVAIAQQLQASVGTFKLEEK